MHSYMTHPVRILLLYIQDGSPPKKDKVDEAVVEEKKVRYVFFGERYVISMQKDMSFLCGAFVSLDVWAYDS